MNDSILNSLNVGIVILNEELKVFCWNKWLESHTGIKKAEIVDKKLTDFFQDLEVSILKRKIKTALTLKSTTFYEPLSKEYFLPIPLDRLLNADLEYMYQKTTIAPYEDGKVILAIYDQSEVYVANSRLVEENEKAKSLNNELAQDKDIIDKNLMILKTTLDGEIIEASTALKEFYGLTDEEVLGQNPKIFRHPEMPTVIFKNLWQTLEKGETWKGEVKNIDKDGQVHWVDSTVSPFRNAYGEIEFYTAIYHDISDKKRIEELSKIDPLTKMCNRGHFDFVFENEFNSHRERPLSFMILDIDHFKNVNDTYGHKAGDLVLQEFANLLKKTIRTEDMSFRIGGEEFVILLPHTDQKNACIVGEKIRKVIEETPFSEVGKLTCSIGVAQKHENDTQEILYERADNCLYSAKRGGRNQVVS